MDIKVGDILLFKDGGAFTIGVLICDIEDEYAYYKYVNKDGTTSLTPGNINCNFFIDGLKRGDFYKNKNRVIKRTGTI